MRRLVVLGVVGMLGGLSALSGQAPKDTSLRFEVSLVKGLLSAPTDGRLVVVLGKRATPEPRRTIGTNARLGMAVSPVLGADARFGPGGTVVLDGKCLLFPQGNLANVPAGNYHAQALFIHNRDLLFPNAPGNLYSDPSAVHLDQAKGGTVKLELKHAIAEEKPPADTANVKFLKFRSERLSKFHGRPIYLRAGLVLPSGFEKEKDRKYPLRVHISGFGGRYTNVSWFVFPRSANRAVWEAKDGPRFLLLHLDGAGPLGDPYQVNSANHGPYGDAITQELIPYVEKTYRGIGAGWARVLDGASTGGWVSLALQTFYPDFFNGAWSHAPDPVDFRAFELINIYRDANAYTNDGGFERPSCRSLDGDTRFTMRYEVLLERVLGRGGDWTLSGRDWGSWNATFAPRGSDGRPLPLWEGKSGRIDRTVAEAYQKYDLRLQMQKNWATLGPKLRGKLRIWVGDADDYFLNNAVRRLDAFLKRARPAYEGQITFAPYQGHGYRGLSEKQMVEEMWAAVQRGRKAAEASKGG
jgi:hypothetical protein